MDRSQEAPEDARWNADMQAVEFGVGIGEYDGVVRVRQLVFRRFIDGAVTPERCVEAYHLYRTRFERIVERKLRSRQLTDDGNVEITARGTPKHEEKAWRDSSGPEHLSLQPDLPGGSLAGSGPRFDPRRLHAMRLVWFRYSLSAAGLVEHGGTCTTPKARPKSDLPCQVNGIWPTLRSPRLHAVRPEPNANHAPGARRDSSRPSDTLWEEIAEPRSAEPGASLTRERRKLTQVKQRVPARAGPGFRRDAGNQRACSHPSAPSAARGAPMKIYRHRRGGTRRALIDSPRPICRAAA